MGGGARGEGRSADPGFAKAVNAWYRAHGRDFLWRKPGYSAWGIYLIEVMAQQTQIERAASAALEWETRWPRPSALAAESPAEVLRAWGRLGYPRRALAVHRAAAVMAAEHGDRVPSDLDTLLALPGVGPYTASAVASFAYGQRVPVVDTNIRRVLARALEGVAALPPNARRDAALMESVLPDDPEEAKTTNVAVMELGALVCTPRNPDCLACPLQDSCAWRAAGYPELEGTARRPAPRFEGSDREVRGQIMALLRNAPGPLPRAAFAAAAADPAQVERCLESLIRDGLASRAGRRFALPGA